MRSVLFMSATAAALCGVGAPALAEDAGTTVSELVVTATRTPVRADRIGQQVTVIDLAQITAQQTPVLSDILARTPGVSFSRNGGIGSATQVYIRGAAAGQTEVLVDGVKLNDPTATDTAVDFGNLLVGDIARVEILRGPQSVLWGSQAIGGVVNLITTQPDKPFQGDVTVEGGSHDWGFGRVGVGGKTDRVTWRASAAYLTTSGISAFDERYGGREADGYRNVGGNLQADLRLTDQLSLDLRTLYTRGRADFDGFPPPNYVFADDREYGTTDNFVGYAGLHLDLFDGRLKSRLAYEQTNTDRQDFNPDQDVTEVTYKAAGRNQRVEYQGDLTIAGSWGAVFGAQHERATLRTASPSDFDPNPARLMLSQDLDDGYLMIHGDALAGLTLSGGARIDHQAGYGDHVVGQASLVWRLNDDNTIVRASWGQGFKAPSLYQLGSEYGNPNLRPETGAGWDAGVEQHFLDGRAQLNVAYFQRRTKDEIDFLDCTGAPDPLCVGAGGLPRFGYYANLDQTRVQGVELSGQAQITDALSVDANYTWLDARGGPDFDFQLPRRPAHEANAEASYRWPVALTTTVAAHYASGRYDDVANTIFLKGYLLWDLRADYPLRPGLSVYGRVENLFNHHYETAYQYGQLGRAAYVGLRATF